MPVEQKLREQIAHHYGPIPKRASAASVTTEGQRATLHHAGHTIGIHPEDSPPVTRQNHLPRTNAPVGDDDERLYPQRSPSSVRYRPAQRQSGKPEHGKGFYSLIVGGSIIIGALIASVVPPLWQRTSDQLTYGFPRTYQIDANVGHGTDKHPNTHFIVLNNHGYIEVLEIPQGIPEKGKVHLYLIAQPDNAAADQVPATLEFSDINADNKLDMIVKCNNNRFVWYNDGNTFKETL